MHDIFSAIANTRLRKPRECVESEYLSQKVTYNFLGIRWIYNVMLVGPVNDLYLMFSYIEVAEVRTLNEYLLGM